MMQNTTNENCVELLNELKILCDKISISDLDITEDDKELMSEGLHQTKKFIANCIRILADKE